MSDEPKAKRVRETPLAELFAVADDVAVTAAFLRARAAALCRALLTRCVLHAGAARYRITELECYHRDAAAWPDPFTHGAALQLTAARWYFHRTGAAYRGGTYKGLDITCGIARTHTHGGLLIRGLRRLSPSSSSSDDNEEDTVDGPCLCVERILAATGHASIAALVAACLPGGERDTSVLDSRGGAAALWLEDCGAAADTLGDTPALFCTPRIGLTLKSSGSSSSSERAQREEYLFARLRVVTAATRSRKGRAHALLALQLCGACGAAQALAAAVGPGARAADVRAAGERAARAEAQVARLSPAAARARIAACHGRAFARGEWDVLLAAAHRAGLDTPLLPDDVVPQ